MDATTTAQLANTLHTTTMTQVATAITAIGALGTAAFGLTDAFKAIPGGGLSRFGLHFLTCLIDKVAPTGEDGTIPAGSALTNSEIDATVKANWINGMASSDQKSVVKALVKLRLNAANAGSLASLTGVDPTVLSIVAAKLASGAALLPTEMDAYGRFDLVLSTSIDRAYQDADQRYRNWAKIFAGAIAVVLSISAVAILGVHGDGVYFKAFLVGLVATPLAPIAKDLTTALNTAVKAVKTVGA
jgi:hypothetical protein